MKKVFLALLCLLLISLVACSSQQKVEQPAVASEQPAANPPEKVIPPAAPSQPAENEKVAPVPGHLEKKEVTVIIKGFKFVPETIDVDWGTTVTWKNEDSASHTVKFDDWESEELFQGATAWKTMSNTGSFSYSCGIHSSMKGKVNVKAVIK